MLSKISTEPNILLLARSIVENTETVSRYLQQNDLPQPSFDLDGPTESPVPSHAFKIEAARQSVIEATEELKLLMLGPTEYMSNIRSNDLLGMQMVSRFRVPKLFPIGSEISFERIASQIGLGYSTTKRLLRQAILKGIFIEPQNGYLAHNAASKALATNEKLLDNLAFTTDEMWQASAQTINALVKWPGSDELHETGFNLAFNTQNTMYEEIKLSPKRSKRFDNAISLLGDVSGSKLDCMVQGYAWDGLGDDALIVDVGGAYGQTCRALAAAYPRLHFITQDLPHVVANAPPSSDGRVQMMGHDFFKPQPVHGADIYFIRRVLHNWSDESAIAILRNLVPALKTGARVVVVDEIVLPPGVLLPSLEDRIRNVDLCMLSCYNSKVRDMEDWENLFANADPRFKLKQTNTPPESVISFMELVWSPSQ